MSRSAERLKSTLKELALSRVRGSRDRGVVRQRCFGVAPQSSEQIGADRMEQVVATKVEAINEGERSMAPSTSATATARLSATTGPGASVKRWLYSCRTCRQSVSAAVGASLWTALIAAWS